MIELLLEAERALSFGRVDRAEQLYRQVAGNDPRNSIAVVGLARVALERSDDLGAYLLARRALAIDPENEAAQRLATRLEEVLRTRGEAVPETPDVPGWPSLPSSASSPTGPKPGAGIRLPVRVPPPAGEPPQAGVPPPAGEPPQAGVPPPADAPPPSSPATDDRPVKPGDPKPRPRRRRSLLDRIRRR